MKYLCEATDLFGGEANYCWVNRKEIDVPDDTSDLALVRRAKAALGYTGVKCRRETYSGIIELRPYSLHHVIFIVPCY